MKIAKYIFTIVIVFGLLAFVVLRLIPQVKGAFSTKQSNNISAPSENSIAQTSVASTVPSFYLKDLKGQEVHLQDYKDKLILVNFWASWCGPCNDEAPSLERMYKELHSKGLVVIGISIDRHVPEVKKFVKLYSITFPVLLDTDESAASAYGITGVPETFILNHNYKLIKHVIGPLDWTSPDVMSYLTGLLKEEK